MSKLTTKNIIHFISWLCVILIAVVAIVAKIIPSIENICRMIALILGVFAAVLGAAYFASSRRNKLYLVSLVLAVVLIVVFYLL